MLRASEVSVVEAEDVGQIHSHGISNRIALFSTVRGGRSRRHAEYTGLIG